MMNSHWIVDYLWIDFLHVFSNEADSHRDEVSLRGKIVGCYSSFHVSLF